jgi:membrane protein DedA with SNARE-associated domain
LSITEFLKGITLTIMEALGYPGLGLIMLVENVFPPIPSEIVLPLAGSLTLQGTFSLPGITVVGVAGSVSGAWIFYAAGGYFDRARLQRLTQRYGRWLGLSVADLDRAFQWFERYGDWVVFFGRMVPIVRSLISVPAGSARMNRVRFTLFTALGTGIWTFVLAYCGRLLGQNWARVTQFIERYQLLVLIVLAIAVVVYVGVRLNRYLGRSRSQETDS